jgi:hypothetical protein
MCVVACVAVRERSRAIIELLNDPERLAEEREKAKHNRGKYTDSMGSEGTMRPLLSFHCEVIDD